MVSQPSFKQKRQVFGSVKDPVLRNKAESNRTSASSSGIYTCTEMHTDTCRHYMQIAGTHTHLYQNKNVEGGG